MASAIKPTSSFRVWTLRLRLLPTTGTATTGAACPSEPSGAQGTLQDACGATLLHVTAAVAATADTAGKGESVGAKQSRQVHAGRPAHATFKATLAALRDKSRKAVPGTWLQHAAMDGGRLTLHFLRAAFLHEVTAWLHVWRLFDEPGSLHPVPATAAVAAAGHAAAGAWACGWCSNAELEAAMTKDAVGGEPAHTDGTAEPSAATAGATRPATAGAGSAGPPITEATRPPSAGAGSAGPPIEREAGDSESEDEEGATATALQLAALGLPTTLEVLNDDQLRLLLEDIARRQDAPLLCALLRLRYARRRLGARARVHCMLHALRALMQHAPARRQLLDGQGLVWLSCIMRTHKDAKVLVAAYALFEACAATPSAHAAIRTDWRLADTMPALLQHGSLPTAPRPRLLHALALLAQHEANRAALRGRAEPLAVTLVSTANTALGTSEDEDAWSRDILRARAASAMSWLCEDVVFREALARAGVVGVLLPLMRADRAQYRGWWIDSSD